MEEKIILEVISNFCYFTDVARFSILCFHIKIRQFIYKNGQNLNNKWIESGLNAWFHFVDVLVSKIFSEGILDVLFSF